MKQLTVQEIIEDKIYLIRGQRVMLDRDLAVLYGVPTSRLNEQVKRNKKRFPEDFMFKLTREEDKALRSQNAILKRGEHSKYLTNAFTEQGVAMLSSVLNSDQAIQVNIEIMRTFIKLRRILSEHKELLKKIEEIEKHYDRQFRIIFEIIKELTETKKKTPIKQIGFKIE